MKRKRYHKPNIGYRTKRKIVFTISIIVLALLFAFRNLNFIILALSSIALITVFYLTDHLFDARFKPRHYFYITFIAITGFLLFNLYSIYPRYDKILHFVQPLMLSSIVFHMVLEHELKLKWTLFFTFFIVTGTVGLFEIGEYTLDVFFDLNLQGVALRNIQEFGEQLVVVQKPLDDTMIDMSLGVLGSITYISFILIFCRKRIALRKWH